MADVTLFENANFQGRNKTLGLGRHRLADSADLNDLASSIRVPNGLVALVHDSADGTGGFGASADFMEDHADLSSLAFDNRISFVEVFSAKNPAGLVWARGSIVNGSYVAGHFKHRSASGEAPNTRVVISPDPAAATLLHISSITGNAWKNPPFDTSDPNWSSKVAGGKTFDGSSSHPFEWVSVLNPDQERDDEVGLSGIALSPDLSGADLPFTHPFGNDFEFTIVPDPEYDGLLATANKDPNGVYRSSWTSARKSGLPIASGVLGLEIEGPLVPPEYRVEHLDRVAVYGRWIVDAGHPEFHTEIHPPLLIGRARTVDDNNKPVRPAANATTLFQLWSRPYEAGQLFKNDGDSGLPFREYATRIVSTLGDIEAFPPIFDTAFEGLHLIAFTIDPPIPQSAFGSPAEALTQQLQCSYHFTTNSSCGIEVIPALGRANSVMVILSLNSVGYPKLPEPDSSFDTFSIAKLLDQAPKGTDIGFLEGIFLKIKSDVKIRRFNSPKMPSKPGFLDSSGLVRFTPLGSLPRSAKVANDKQPFPIYGWLKLKWVDTRVKQPPGKTLPGE